jgi:outer membrane biosynthesis protein TonB
MKLPRFFAAVVGCSLAFQNDASQPKRLRIALEDAVSMRTHSVEPEYPESALADHVSERPVFLSIAIDKQGKVTEAAPVPRDEWPPNWFFSEDARLRDAAIQAIKQWEYKPYLLNGQPVEVETRAVVKFKTRPSAGGGVIGVPGGVGGVPGGSGGVIGEIIGSAAPPPKPAVQQLLRVSAAVMEGNLLKHVDPVYALISRNAPMRGEVQLLARVSRTGVVEKLVGISGHPILMQSAMAAVRQWQYKPFLLNGEPIEAEGMVIVVFKR